MNRNDMMLKEYRSDTSIKGLDFIRLAVVLTEMVCREHHRTTVIGNLNPGNIRMLKGGKEARLTGSVGVQSAYRSPEQSGRLNHMPDNRSDLYTLGVILYELLSGQLPLQPDDGDWDTAHIFKAPLPLSDIRSEWSGPISSIVMKLLSKSPDYRYQSAYGLLDDLNQCLVMLEDDGKLVSFELGRLDQVRMYRQPEALYGREVDMTKLESGLVQASQGRQVIRWITGPEGSGKTALIHRLRANVVRQGGWFIEGQLIRDGTAVPYEPFIQALQVWLQQLWREPADVIERFREKLHSAFGQDASVIVSILPGMRQLFGSTAGQDHVPDAMKRKRMGELLPGLIGCLADSFPPLVIFIDNLECADSGTREVIGALAQQEMARGLLIIGAVRTDEWNTTHGGDSGEITSDPWHTVSSLSTYDERVDLQPLCFEDVRRYVADALYEGTPRLRMLASTLYYKTGGSPGMIAEMMDGWLQENRLSFDENQRQWVWDSEVLQQSYGSDMDYHLMKAGFAQLTVPAKRMLVMAAAIGRTFTLSLLAEACECTVNEAALMLRDAELGGMIGYEDNTEVEDTRGKSYLFLHHQLREIAYAFDREGNALRHLTIGRLLRRSQKEGGGHALLAAVDQLNLGAEAMSLQEREQLLELNLQVGHSALDEGQFVKSKHYGQAGLMLSEEEQVPQPGSLYVQLRLLTAWSEYMSGNTEQARQNLLDLKKRNHNLSLLERSKIWLPLIQIHTFAENDLAVQYGKEALEAYGWEYREGVSKLGVIKEVMRTQTVLYRKRSKLPLLPFNTDEEYLNLCKYMEYCFLPMLTHNAEALIELCARFIRYGIGRGMNGSLAMLICSYSLLMQRVLPSYAGVVPALDLEMIAAADDEDDSRVYRILLIVGMARQLDNPTEASVLLNKALRRSLEQGDKNFANVMFITCLITHNGNLQDITDLLTIFTEHLEPIASNKTLEIANISRRYLAALQGESSMEDFTAIPDDADQNSWLIDEDNYSCMCKLEVAYLAGRYHEALYWSRRSKESELAADWVRIRKQRTYEALTLAAMHPEAVPEEQKRIRKILSAQLRSMKKWKGFLGIGSSAYLLMKAECARLAGNQLKTLRLYLDAIKQARMEKYGLMEGIACERLAICYEQDLISNGGAMIAMLDAGTAYSLWGVTSKVTQIRSEHAHLLSAGPKLYEVETIRLQKYEGESVHPRLPQQETFKKPEASMGEEELLQQLLYGFGELRKGQWAESLLNTAIRQSGADRGLILRNEKGRFAVVSSFHKEDNGYAESVLRYTVATDEPIVIHDAVQGYWMRDDDIALRKPRSIFCMPVSVPGEPFGYFVYLENSHVPGVFTERDLKVLEWMAIRMIYFNLLDGESKDTATIEEPSPFVRSGDQGHMIESLTKRELEILEAISEGLSNKDIAELLGITETTVKTHVSRIFGKLGVKRRGQAVVRANELDLIRK
ncbi:AAA family ATPase [Paenibacillus paeoniae]|uniref:Winged helix-turn-helix transcriptional regulator n=1 Tax=Paenibacillus paeoniae TaxID=2292705 RepID=A0A371PFI1_9BACL|nr:AAA family ATPase [Paenibacillus paeoniae]REK74376.1 winged helix-turn-helix transcriptional regulator [Paenibacillus paeoniae]